MKKILLILGGFLILGLAGTGIYYGVESGTIQQPSRPNNEPVVFSDNRVLLELWSDYKNTIIETSSGRAVDRSMDNITTSEGQSYTMMRAVWMDDMVTFDKAWQWTKDNLQRDDSLMSWKFGPLNDGKDSYGIQTAIGGQNTATDADVDIAYALVMASNRWKESKYLYDASPIIKSIWEKEVVTINNKPTLAANDLERENQQSILINPSYFAPYAYRVFAQVNPENNWMAVVDSSYELLFATADATLDTPKSTGLTPNWARVNRATSAIEPATSLDSNYGYDAFRTSWRMALDFKYYQDVRAKQVVAKYKTIGEAWTKNKELNAVYSHDGKVVSKDTVPAAYGGSLGYFILNNPNTAKEVFDAKLSTLYDPDTQGWKQPLSYYDDNWAWFGMALYYDALPNIGGQYGK